jgi:hypothetical protein
MFVLGLTTGFYSAQGLVTSFRGPRHYFLFPEGAIWILHPPNLTCSLDHGWYWVDGGYGAYIVTRH